MMPLRPSPRRPIVVGKSIPAPVGGLNYRDSIADMDELDALIMDNYFPSTNDVRLRRGYAEHVTGITGNVETLMEWAGMTTRKLFAANDSAIYDVSSSGTVGSAAVSSQSNGRWQHINVAIAGTSYLYAVNGEDKAQLYNGTAWTTIDAASTPAITGIATTNLININLHKGRIWFIEKDSTSAWYLGTNSIGGAATEFDLGDNFSLGGHLVAMGTWTRDGGSGADDIAVFISSLGQVALYAGTDPATADTWARVGVFNIGAPIGNRCLLKAGADLAIITVDGIVPLSAILGVDRAASRRVAITDKINKLFSDSARSYGSNFGWQGISYPRGNMAVFNVPVSSSTAHQYVMNTLTGAWCRFKNQDAFCWALFNDELYFGGNGAVYKADTGFNDNGANIDGDLKPAFNYFGSRGRLKRFTMLRPIISSSGIPRPAIEMNINYEDRIPTATPNVTAGSTSLWDVGKWDSATWSGDAEITQDWISVVGTGYCGTVRMRTASQDMSIQVNAFDVLFEPSTAFV